MNTIKQFRTQLKLTKSQMATLFGVSVSAVIKWENGQRSINPIAARFLEILGLIQIVSPELFSQLIKESKKEVV